MMEGHQSVVEAFAAVMRQKRGCNGRCLGKGSWMRLNLQRRRVWLGDSGGGRRGEWLGAERTRKSDIGSSH